MFDGAGNSSGARKIEATMNGFVLGTHKYVATDRTVRGELPLAQTLWTIGEHRTDDLRDDITRFSHNDGVAGAHILHRNLILVMERGEFDC
jgi:hypothetical protein